MTWDMVLDGLIKRIVQFSRLPPTSQRYLGSILTRIPTGIKVRGQENLVFICVKSWHATCLFFKSPNPLSPGPLQNTSLLHAGIKGLQYLPQRSARHLFYHVLEPHNRWTHWNHIQRICTLNAFYPFWKYFIHIGLHLCRWRIICTSPFTTKLSQSAKPRDIISFQQVKFCLRTEHEKKIKVDIHLWIFPEYVYLNMTNSNDTKSFHI